VLPTLTSSFAGCKGGTREQSVIRGVDMATVRFPDGTTVEAVGIRERCPDKAERNYGFYLL
jgi:hypothetical protein